MITLAASALASPPSLCEVCTVPADLAFSTRAATEAVEGADHTFRVVVIDDVGTDRGSFGSPTELQLEQTWNAWTADPAFSASDDVLVVLGVRARRIQVKTGARWDADFGLWGDALLPFIDEHFIPMAKAGDLDGGLARLVRGIDAELTRREAQEAQAIWRKQVLPTVGLGETVHVPADATVDLTRTRAGATGPVTIVTFAESLPGGLGPRGTANELLRDALLRANPDLKSATLVVVTADEGVVHAQPAASSAAIWPRTARLGGPDESIDQTVANLIAELEAARVAKEAALEAARIARLEREASDWQVAVDKAVSRVRREEVAAQGFKGFALGLATLIPGILAAMWIGRVRRAREEFEAAVEERSRQLKQARENLAELTIDVETRDRLVELKLKGPVTLDTLAAVGDAIATLHAGLDALERQLAEILGDKPGMAFHPAIWRGMADRLDRALVFSTEDAERGLFDAPVSVHEVHPSGFMAELDLSFLDARAGWYRILDAADAALSKAQDDLPEHNLEAMRAQLKASGLPDTWLSTHPLVPSAAATWARLDEARHHDPVHYLDLLEASLAEDDELHRIVAELVGVRSAAREAREAMNEATLDDLTTAYSSPDLSPHTHREGARAQHVELERCLGSGSDLEGVRRQSARAIADSEAVCGLFEEVRQAVNEGAQKLADARDALQDLRAARGHHARRLAELLENTAGKTLGDAQRELRELDEDTGQASSAMQEAEAHWGGGRHLEATRCAARCRAEAREGTVDLTEFVGFLEAAVAERAEARALFDALAKHRAAQRRALDDLKAHAKALGFEKGDELERALRERWDAPADWTERIAALRAIEEAWKEPVSTARQRKADHDARIARERAARAAAARRSASSYSSSSSSSSYRSTSSSSSSWSSSRSSGSSFSSSSRSSGSSFSSGGRSGGRSW